MPNEFQQSPARSVSAVTLDDALAKIFSHCGPLPAVSVPLEDSFGHVLRETVCAPTDLPDHDRSTRDGYAILDCDPSETFHVVDTLHAGDWKPRQLKPGEAVRVATGASMPGANLRVVMQEDVERNEDKIRVIRRDNDFNIRRRGEEIKAGAPLVQAGARLDAGHLALLASAGCVRPPVSPRLRVVHFTTGDEVVPAHQEPKPGQIRDSNSILIKGLLKRFPSELFQDHLREDFETAKEQIRNRKNEIERADVVLISGGASVGDKDFTRPLLEWLGFKIVFGKVAIRPGRPTIFGVNGQRIAFGLPGNPLAHFVCFHLFVAQALAGLSGGEAKRLLRGKLAEPLKDASNPRETLWPARLDFNGGEARLHPLGWSSSGDVTGLTQANALLRVPPNCEAIEAGAELDFLSA
jgi:molybdopterin molybdotransferase